jgi:outer membrane protein TolC
MMRRSMMVGITALGLLAPLHALAQDEPAPDESASPASGAPPASTSQTPAEPEPLPVPPELPARLEGQIPLSLRDALALSIENNLDVEISRFDPLIADEVVLSAWGAYDPTASADWNYERAEVPTANPLNSGRGVDILDNDQIGGTGGMRGLVPKWGAAYQVAYVGQSVETSSGFPNLSPEYTTDLSARVSLPLLRGFLWGEPWVQVQAARIGQTTSGDTFIQSLMDTIGSTTPQQEGVEILYWELIAARENLGVSEKSLETARALLDQTNAQYDVGVVSRVEVVEAEAGVADRKFQRILRDNEYWSAQDRLIDQVFGERLRSESRFEIVPTDSPEPVPYEVDPEEAARKAFANRPEIATAQQEIERRDLLLRFAQNQRLPQLDVIGGYGYTGISGKTNPEPPSFGNRTQIPIARRYGAADDDFFSSDGARTWSGGAVFSIPLGNTRGRADARAAALELRKAQSQLVRAEQTVVLEVREAIRNLLSAQEGILAAQEARRSAEEQLRAERIRLEHGESTPFNVLQKEEDYRTAEFQYIFALRGYRNSITALDRAQGTILRDRGIEVEAARELR